MRLLEPPLLRGRKGTAPEPGSGRSSICPARRVHSAARPLRRQACGKWGRLPLSPLFPISDSLFGRPVTGV